MKKIDARIGTVLEGRYYIEKKIATGGMSVVYAGKRLQLGRSVAVKFLQSSLCRDSAFFKRFEREAKAMSQLSHPNCISVIDFGIADVPYLVMDLVQGRTLRHIMKKGPIETVRALLILRQILAGLSHAHKRGIIHRDIKPGNIMVTEADCAGDHVRVFDFGLAKHLGASEEDLTGKGIVAGTVEYLAPENTGRDGTKIVLDERTDLFSVGVVAYQMLTGMKPFVAPSPVEIFHMHDSLPLPLNDSNMHGSFSPELENVIAKALSIYPKDRYQNAEEFVNALDEVLQMEGVTLRSIPPPPIETAKHDASSLTPVVSNSSQNKRSHFKFWIPILIFVAISFGLGVWMGTSRDNNTEESNEAPLRTTDNSPPKKASDSSNNLASSVKASVGLPGRTETLRKVDNNSAAATDETRVLVFEDTEENLDTSASMDGNKQPDEAAADSQLRTIKKDAREELYSLMYLIRTNKFTTALAKLDDLQREFPNDAYVYFLQGNLQSQMRNRRQSIDYYKRTLELNKNYSNHKILIRNLVRMLADNQHHEEVATMIEQDIGEAARPYLVSAYRGSQSPKFRKRILNILRKFNSSD